MTDTKCPDCKTQASDRAGACPHCGCPRIGKIPAFSTALHKLAETYSIHVRAYNRLLLFLWTVCVVALSEPDKADDKTVTLLVFEMSPVTLHSFCLIIILLLAIAIATALTQLHYCRAAYMAAVDLECTSTENDGAPGDVQMKHLAHMLYHPGFTRVYPIARAMGPSTALSRHVYRMLYGLVSVLVFVVPSFIAWHIALFKSTWRIRVPATDPGKYLPGQCWTVPVAILATCVMGWRLRREFKSRGGASEAKQTGKRNC